jgi:hypothetical protein
MSNITQINDQLLNADTASFVNGNIFTSTNPALSASYALTSSFLPVGTYQITASWAQSASQALTASVVLDKSTYSAGIISGSGWSNPSPLDGTIIVPNVKAALYSTVDFSGPLYVYDITGGVISTLSDNDTNYIYVDYNNGSPQYSVTQDYNEINYSNKVLDLIVYRAGNFIHVLEFGNQGAGLASKMNDRFITVDRFARESGLELILDTTNGYVTASAGVAWNGSYRQQLAEINSGTDIFFRSYHSASVWVYNTSADTINNFIYDTGIDTASVSPGKYLTNWYYRGQEVNDHIYEVVSSGEYDSVAAAQLATQPNLPELISSHAFLMGRIIVQSGSFDGIVESAYEQVFSPTSVTKHNDLTNIQGGSSGEYYHLTQADYNIVVSGTSSWASSSLTASYLNPGTYQITASWAESSSQAISSSYALTASYAMNGGGGGGITEIQAGDSSINVTNGTGPIVTLTANGGGGTNLGLVYVVSIGYIMP